MPMVFSKAFHKYLEQPTDVTKEFFSIESQNYCCGISHLWQFINSATGFTKREYTEPEKVKMCKTIDAYCDSSRANMVYYAPPVGDYLYQIKFLEEIGFKQHGPTLQNYLHHGRGLNMYILYYTS